MIYVWAVRLLSLSGVTPRPLPGSASGPASCFAWQISSCLRGVQEAVQGRRSRVRGPKVGCRGGDMPHLRATTAAGSAAAVLTRRSRRWPQGRAGAVVHECAGRAGDRVRGFPVSDGDDDMPRGGDGVPRRAARSDGTPPMTARLASVIGRWVGWAARRRGRCGRDHRRWPRFRPDSSGAGSQCRLGRYRRRGCGRCAAPVMTGDVLSPDAPWLRGRGWPGGCAMVQRTP
jgi:hypothetical protein